MREFTGKYNTLKVYSDDLDKATIGDLNALCNLAFIQGSKIRVMPDVHAGKGCTIGTTMTISDKVVPSFVGVDIGCGMEVCRLKDKEIDFIALDSIIRDNIPYGQDIRRSPHSFIDQVDLDSLKCKDEVNIERARRSIGSLGSGNHFIEVDKAEDGTLYLVVHSGSRHLGLEVCNYYQNEGYKKLQKKRKDLIREDYTRANNEEFDNMYPKTKFFAYVEGEFFEDYLHDMKIVQHFAYVNRKAMVHEIVTNLRLEVEDCFTTTHNYINTEEMMLRKGAVSAKKGERFIIPINMRDGALICIGKGNEDWNNSAPHGAGRLYSRKQAFEELSTGQYIKDMEGIFSTCVNSKTLDESPRAYKPIDEIIKNIEETADIELRIKPVYNFKAPS